MHESSLRPQDQEARRHETSSSLVTSLKSYGGSSPIKTMAILLIRTIGLSRVNALIRSLRFPLEDQTITVIASARM